MRGHCRQSIAAPGGSCDQLPPEVVPARGRAAAGARDTAAADAAARRSPQGRAVTALDRPREIRRLLDDGLDFGATTTSCTRNAASSASGTSPTPPRVTALGLHALQHRGQEATGIVTFDGSRFHSHRGLGLVGDNFGDAKVIAALPGAHRHRPQPLRHHRRHHPAQRPAAVRRFRVRRLRRRA